jgi:HEAT repeat protein
VIFKKSVRHTTMDLFATEDRSMQRGRGPWSGGLLGGWRDQAGQEQIEERSMTNETASNEACNRVVGLFQIRLARLMVLVAIIAILLSAWVYNRDYGSGPRAWASIQISALSDVDVARRRQAAENLYHVEAEDLARTLVALAGALSDTDWPVRVAAARSLPQAIGYQGRVLSEEIEFATMALIPVCRDPRDEVRIEAVRAIGRLNDSNRTPAPAGVAPVVQTAVGSVARQALNALLEAMKDPSPQVRAQALSSIAWVCGGDAGPVKAMLEHDPEIKVRIAAVNALARGWPDDPLLYPLLLGRLKVVTDPAERAAIGWALSSLAPASTENLPALLGALSPDDPVLRHCIAVALGKLGPAARPALPNLARVARIELADPDSSLSAVHAIITIDPKSPEALALVEPLITLIKDSRSESQQNEAVNLLGGFATPSAAVVKALREALKSKNRDVRERARIALKSINTSTPMNSLPWPFPLP